MENRMKWTLAIIGAFAVGLIVSTILSTPAGATSQEAPVFDPAVTVNGDCNGWSVDANPKDVEVNRVVTWKYTSKSGVGKGVWDATNSYDYKVTVTWKKFYGPYESSKFHDEIVEGNLTKPGDCPKVTPTPTPTPTATVAAAVAPAVTQLPATGSSSLPYVAGLMILGSGLSFWLIAKGLKEEA